MPTLLLLINGCGRGGAETQAMRLGFGLCDRGWHVEIRSLRNRHQFDLADLPGTMRVQSLLPVDKADPLEAWQRARQALDLLRPDGVLTFTCAANLLGRALATERPGLRLVTSLRNERLGGRMRELALRASARLDVRTVTNAQSVAERLQRRGFGGPGGIEVIPNALDVRVQRVDPASRRRFRDKLDAGSSFVWLAVGNHREQKDYATLLHAMARLPASVRLWIAGKTYGSSAVVDQAEALGLASRVRVLGMRDDVPALLAAADAVVSSSAWEGLPNGLLEACCAGRTIVATDVGGTSELVRRGMNGLLVPSGDALALADAMIEWMSMDEERRSAGAAVMREHVLARFDPDRVFERWDRLLREAFFGERM